VLGHDPSLRRDNTQVFAATAVMCPSHIHQDADTENELQMSLLYR